MKMKICAEPGCNAVVQQGERYCAKHKASHIRKPFENATRAGNYHTPEWRRLRKKIVEEHPYCAMCGSRERLEVHHIKPVRYNPELMGDESNLMVLCSQCHKFVTRREIEERKK